MKQAVGKSRVSGIIPALDERVLAGAMMESAQRTSECGLGAEWDLSDVLQSRD